VSSIHEGTMQSWKILNRKVIGNYCLSKQNKLKIGNYMVYSTMIQTLEPVSMKHTPNTHWTAMGI